MEPLELSSSSYKSEELERRLSGSIKSATRRLVLVAGPPCRGLPLQELLGPPEAIAGRLK